MTARHTLRRLVANALPDRLSWQLVHFGFLCQHLFARGEIVAILDLLSVREITLAGSVRVPVAEAGGWSSVSGNLRASSATVLDRDDQDGDRQRYCSYPPAISLAAGMTTARQVKIQKMLTLIA